MTACDVIIPTHNGQATIAAALRALFTQTVPSGWTVRAIISDDGSSDDTLACAASVYPPPPWHPICLLQGPHTGAAGARNRGLVRSDATLILWLGADILLRPGALAAHLNFHAAHPAPRDAALGFLQWDPRVQPSPFMAWMVHGGGQNDFDSLLGCATADPRRFFYASHVSMKRRVLTQQRFPEVYHSYGWEDIDLGRTLAPHLTLHVLHDALGLHRHVYEPHDIYRRQFAVGRNLILYQQRHPGTPLVPRRARSHYYKHRLLSACGLLSLLSWCIAKSAARWNTPRLFARVTALHFWQGVYSHSKLSPET